MTDNEQEAQIKRLNYWQAAARRDRETAQSLLELKRYDWSLFIYHLALEKLLKAFRHHIPNPDFKNGMIKG